MAKRFKVTSSSKNILLVFLFSLIAIWGVKLKLSRNAAEKPAEVTVQKQMVDSSQTPVSNIGLGNDFQMKTKPIVYGNYVIRTVVVTSVMLALIFGMYWISKRRFKNDSSMINDISILGRRYLNNKQYLMIVQAGKKKLLLGVSDHNINFLSDLGHETETEDREEKLENREEDTSTFDNILKKINITHKDLE